MKPSVFRWGTRTHMSVLCHQIECFSVVVSVVKGFVQGYKPAFAQAEKSKNNPLKLMTHTCC